VIEILYMFFKKMVIKIIGGMVPGVGGQWSVRNPFNVDQ
jgi:hypothetical protein